LISFKSLLLSERSNCAVFPSSRCLFNTCRYMAATSCVRICLIIIKQIKSFTCCCPVCWFEVYRKAACNNRDPLRKFAWCY